MEFLRQHIRPLAISGSVISILILAYHFGWLMPLQRILGWTLQPVEQRLYRVIDQLKPMYQTTNVEIVLENDYLKNQLSQLAQQNNQLQTRIEQYKDYQNQLNFAEEKEYTFLSAKIISRIGQNDTLEMFSINQGKNHGVMVGSPVIYNDGVLIGIVHHVDDNYSEVTLLTNSTTKLQAMVINETKTRGLLNGAFSTGLTLEYILKEQSIALGDVVMTQHDDLIPEGLIVGTVQSVSDQSSELFKSAMITPIIHYGANSIVSVIISQP